MRAGRTSARRSLHLLYHELRPEPGSYTYALACVEFERHAELFARMRKEESAERLRPEVTFDDGHVSNHRYALPVLAKHGIEAQFFITAGWTGTKAGYMGWEELRELHRAGQRIGAHGWSHALLTHCSGAELDRELKDARRALEDGLGALVTSLSLPGGRFNAKVLRACREAGYETVFTSVPKAEPIPAGAMPGRLNVRRDASVAWLESVLDARGTALAGLERQYRVKEAAKALLGDGLYARLWGLVNRQEASEETEAASQP